MSISFEQIITITGWKPILNFKNKYDVDEDTTIELKGLFRSAGNQKSKMYFGLHCYKEDGTDIVAQYVYRKDESLLITSKSTDGKSFTLEKKPETWNNSNDSYSEKNYKVIGIYFDGNINRLPDYLINTPAYDKYIDNNIVLNKEIPKEINDKIIPFKTRVMNHYDSSTYDYSAACYVEVPEKWTKYKAVYNGFSKGYGDIIGKFRLGTKKVSPLILPNYQQNNDAILEIRNVEIIVKDKLRIA